MTTKDEKPDSPKRGKHEAHVNIEGSDNVVAIRGIATSIKIVLQNSRPVVTLLLGLVLIGGAIAFLYWMSHQPGRMTGDFNIAVAEFTQVGDSQLKVASILSQQVFRFLDDQAKLITIENVQVAHKNIGLITSAEEAKALAKKINAQVVLYGDVTTIGNQARLTPQFYIAEAFRANVSELNGQQRLAAPITFPIDSIVSPTEDPLQLMQERAVIMTEFTKSLVYLATENLPLSKEAIDKAILYSEGQDPFEGQEVLYVFASQIARLQGDKASARNFVDKALRINPDYGRGYIAKANVFYDEENLYQAIENYKKAKGLPDQPIGAHIVEKASLGIGNSCWVQLQYVKQTPNPDPAAVTNLEQCALDNYQQLIELYTQQKKPEENLKEMAARAYYGAGNIYESRSQLQEAQKMYEQAKEITTDPGLIQQIETGLKEVKS
jgi:tetratricopeptide (TPR) repeat protein